MYTLKDIMMMFDIPERTIRRHMKLGLLQGSKIGGLWRFSEEDITKYASNPAIVHTNRKNNIRRIYEHVNGLTPTKNHILVNINKPKLSKKDMKSLMIKLQSFTDFRFNAEVIGDQHNLTFIAPNKYITLFLQYLSEL